MTPTAPTRTQGGAFLSQTPARIFTPEDFVGDERLMIETADRFSRTEVLPRVEAIDRKEDGLMPALMRKAGELGLTCVDIAEAYGGLGLGKNLGARILEFLSLNASFSVTVGVHAGISQYGLALFGTEAQRQRYLPRLANAEWIGAYALSEPNSGTDALAAVTRATRVEGGYRLTGTKMWISNALWADLFTVFAKVDGEQFTAFLVERSDPGVSISREEHKLGLHGSSTARLLLDEVFVREENVLHEVGLGHQVAFNALNLGRYKLSAMSLGPARHAMEEAAKYAQERKQFGQPICQFGLIREKFAQMAARFYAAESVIYRTGALIDQAFSESDGSIVGNRRACEEFAIECSIAKVLSTETEAFVIDEALQIFGGYGFSEEFPLARHYRDARVSRIYEGTNEINRVFIADRLRRRAKETPELLTSAGDSFVSELAGKALAIAVEHQTPMAAQSDLLILALAEQSARLRARTALGKSLHQEFVRWAYPRAAAAYQVVTGEPIMLPAPPSGDHQEIVVAEALAKPGPLSLSPV